MEKVWAHSGTNESEVSLRAGAGVPEEVGSHWRDLRG